jgi:iron uptake system component EfeO
MVATRWRRTLGGVLAATLMVGALAACGDDDGGTVRDSGGSASGGSASGSGSGSGSGLSEEELEGATDDQDVLDAVAEYRTYVLDQVDDLQTAVQPFTDAVRAGDLEAAKAAYAPSRVPWERIEPVAGLVEDIDTAVDARVDDFEGPDDPEFTGWHRLEYLLFSQGTVEGAAPFADRLDDDLGRLADELPDLDFPPRTVALGPGELIQEVSEGKITGEEDRYSGTDLWDFDANVDGSRELIDILRPVLEERDADLLADIDAGFADIDERLGTYERPDGTWAPYAELTDEDKDALAADLAALAEDLSLLAGTLGLE